MENEILTVEYLISINSKNKFNSCSTEEAFKNLLCSNSDIEIKGNKINYKNIKIEYTIQLSKKENVNFFHMIFKCLDIKGLKLYEEFLRGIKNILDKVSDEGIIVLWDDISVHYCKQAYPLINEVENLMRKLLTKFMMINVGEEWDKLNISTEIRQNISKNKKKLGRYDYLYETDFITLSEFLFKEYPNITYENFNKKIKKLSNPSDFDINEIIRRSNWDRYFKAIVKCEGEFLNKRWKELYELRCKVAHNNTLERSEYESIIKLVNEVKPNLEEVIEKLDKVKLDENSKTTIVENIIENIHPYASSFLGEYTNLNNLVFDIGKHLSLKDFHAEKTLTFTDIIKYLYEIDIIDTHSCRDLIWINNFRYELAYNINSKCREEDMAEAILILVRSIDYLQDIYNKLNKQEF